LFERSGCLREEGVDGAKERLLIALGELLDVLQLAVEAPVLDRAAARRCLRPTEQRSGPTNSDSPISVISARGGDGIARSNGEEDGKKAEKESFGGIQGKGGVGGDSGRQDALGAG